jgi:polyhydroxybutyrate depolymerase
MKARSMRFDATVWLVFFAAFMAAGEPFLERTWTVEGLDRQALLCLPASGNTTNAPVVFSFHGHGGNRVTSAAIFGFHRVWPEALVVYMQGVKTPGKLTDPEGKKTGWQDTPGDYGDRDLKFFDQVLAALKAEYKIDPRRVYATGYSHGGYFTYLLWARRGGDLAAVAPCAATLRAAGAGLEPKPALHFAGTGDTLVKWEWQRETIDRVRALNGCPADGIPWGTTGVLTGVLYDSTNGTPFVTLTHPGNHGTVPPGTSALIVRFFKEH